MSGCAYLYGDTQDGCTVHCTLVDIHYLIFYDINNYLDSDASSLCIVQWIAMQCICVNIVMSFNIGYIVHRNYL